MRGSTGHTCHVCRATGCVVATAINAPAMFVQLVRAAPNTAHATNEAASGVAAATVSTGPLPGTTRE
jgi:hypothetical protein